MKPKYMLLGAALLVVLSSCATEKNQFQQAMADSIRQRALAPQQAPQPSKAFEAFYQGGSL